LQLCVSVLFIVGQGRNNIERTIETVQADKEVDWIRPTLMGGEIPDQVKLCYWNFENNQLLPTDSTCTLQRYDVVINTSALKLFSITDYLEILNGLFRTVHVCDGCKTDLIIRNDGEYNRVDIRSIFALLLFQKVNITDKVKAGYTMALKSRKDLDDKLGKKYIILSGFTDHILLSNITTTFTIVLNVCGLIITALWLAIKAHRKVLDYFSYSGCLLPLVAACGASSFYSAIWIITILRVLIFLGASIPLGIMVFSSLTNSTDTPFFSLTNYPTLTIWIITLASELLLSTLIASITELKRHYSLTSIIYRIMPILISALGGLLWSITFLFETDIVYYIRSFFTLIPIFGLVPIIMTPIFSPNIAILVIHFFITILFFYKIATGNIRWFAAHLEDI
jgi:hypothetical protein